MFICLSSLPSLSVILYLLLFFSLYLPYCFFLSSLWNCHICIFFFLPNLEGVFVLRQPSQVNTFYLVMTGFLLLVRRKAWITLASLYSCTFAICTRSRRVTLPATYRKTSVAFQIKLCTFKKLTYSGWLCRFATCFSVTFSLLDKHLKLCLKLVSFYLASFSFSFFSFKKLLSFISESKNFIQCYSVEHKAKSHLHKN